FPTELVVTAAGGDSLSGCVLFPAFRRSPLDCYAALNINSHVRPVTNREAIGFYSLEFVGQVGMLLHLKEQRTVGFWSVIEQKCGIGQICGSARRVSHADESAAPLGTFNAAHVQNQLPLRVLLSFFRNIRSGVQYFIVGLSDQFRVR